MAPKVSTKYIYHCSGTEESSCSLLEEMQKTESEVYWDLSTITIYTIFFFLIYFHMWMVRFALKLYAAKKIFRIIFVKVKKVLAKLVPVFDKNQDDIDGDQETKNKHQNEEHEKISNNFQYGCDDEIYPWEM